MTSRRMRILKIKYSAKANIVRLLLKIHHTTKHLLSAKVESFSLPKARHRQPGLVHDCLKWDMKRYADDYDHASKT